MRSTRRVISAAARREKVKQHDAARIGAVFDKVHDAMRQRAVLPEPAPAMIEKRTGLRKRQAAVLDSAALLRIELVQARRQHRSRINSGTGFH